MSEIPIDYLRWFLMPKPVSIMGRTSAITNSFINGIIPVVVPSNDEVRTALDILGMTDEVVCAYCGDAFTEWDHLRPLVVDKRPTGYISEIHNLVPACGKCNQSKGNRHWREWMFSTARLSPQARGIPDIDARANRLTQYEDWIPPTCVDFEALAGSEAWAEHWDHHARIIALMAEAQITSTKIREAIKSRYLDGTVHVGVDG